MNGRIRATMWPHLVRISVPPSLSTDQSRTSNAAAAAPTNNACARLSVPK
jgi:hypothetical protein